MYRLIKKLQKHKLLLQTLYYFAILLLFSMCMAYLLAPRAVEGEAFISPVIAVRPQNTQDTTEQVKAPQKPISALTGYAKTETALRVIELAQEHGYSEVEIQNLLALLTRESGIRENAVNPTSHACGIFQRYKCPWEITDINHATRTGTVHASVDEQVANGFAYIDARYGNPIKANQFQLANNYY